MVIAFVTMSQESTGAELLEEFERGLGTTNAVSQTSGNVASQTSTLSREWESVSPPATNVATVHHDPWQGKEVPQSHQTFNPGEDPWNNWTRTQQAAQASTSQEPSQGQQQQSNSQEMMQNIQMMMQQSQTQMMQICIYAFHTKDAGPSIPTSKQEYHKVSNALKSREEMTHLSNVLLGLTWWVAQQPANVSMVADIL